MSKVHKITLSREALLKAVAAVVKEQSVGMAGMDCTAIRAVLVDTTQRNGVTETFPLDTIEVDLVRAAPVVARKVGKLSLAAVDGVAL